MHDHSDQTPHRMERHCDVAIVGGSAAGLAAALQLGRQRRSVIVVDDRRPRNAPAAHMHGYLGHEGLPPADLLAIGSAEVRSYGGEILTGRVVEVTRRDDDRFELALAGGTTVVARKVLAATGLVDLLPDVDGLAEQWGRGVIHCPFCHGYEVRDRRIVQLVTHPMGLHPAALFAQLTDRLTLVLHDGVGADAPELAELRRRGVPIVDVRARRVVTDDDRVRGVELVDGTLLDADVVVVGTRFEVRAEPFASLGVQPVAHASGLGDVVPTDPTGATPVAGLHAAGNVTDPSLQVLGAAANGSWVGAMVASVLAHEDLLSTTTAKGGNEVDWDHRYGGEQVWSGNPNGALVVEVGPLTPGRALDVGAGEGGDALWLAEHGWSVTATDISRRALDRIAGEAERRGVAVECLHADANALEAFGEAKYDLVCAQYASIPRTPDDRGVQNLLGAVAPGGRLLVVSHDLAPMRTPVDPAVEARAFDPDAYVRTDDLLDALRDDPEWTVELHELRPRPAGAASGHHVDDVVLRARRHERSDTDRATG